MSSVIIYPGDSGLSVVTPCNCGLSIAEIASLSVPSGVPFRIVDSSDLPTDPLYATAWTADFSSPDGYGQQGAQPSTPTPTEQGGDE